MTDMYDEKKVPEFTLPPYQHEDHGSEVSCFFVGVLLLVVVRFTEMLGGETEPNETIVTSRESIIFILSSQPTHPLSLLFSLINVGMYVYQHTQISKSTHKTEICRMDSVVPKIR